MKLQGRCQEAAWCILLRNHLSARIATIGAATVMTGLMRLAMHLQCRQSPLDPVFEDTIGGLGEGA